MIERSFVLCTVQRGPRWTTPDISTNHWARLQGMCSPWKHGRNSKCDKLATRPQCPQCLGACWEGIRDVDDFLYSAAVTSDEKQAPDEGKITGDWEHFLHTNRIILTLSLSLSLSLKPNNTTHKSTQTTTSPLRRHPDIGLNYSICPWFAHDLSMVCPWFVHGLSMDCPWFVHGLSMVCPGLVHGLSKPYTFAFLSSSPVRNQESAVLNVQAQQTVSGGLQYKLQPSF